MTATADRDDANFRNWSRRRTTGRRLKAAHQRATNQAAWVAQTRAMAARMLAEIQQDEPEESS